MDILKTSTFLLHLLKSPLPKFHTCYHDCQTQVGKGRVVNCPPKPVHGVGGQKVLFNPPCLMWWVKIVFRFLRESWKCSWFIHIPRFISYPRLQRLRNSNKGYNRQVTMGRTMAGDLYFTFICTAPRQMHLLHPFSLHTPLYSTYVVRCKTTP